MKYDNCQFAALYSMESFRMFPQFKQPRFQEKRIFMKLATFFISSTRRIFIKLLSVSESSIKTKVKSH